jgi:hypothetical protein
MKNGIFAVDNGREMPRECMGMWMGKGGTKAGEGKGRGEGRKGDLGDVAVEAAADACRRGDVKGPGERGEGESEREQEDE